MRTARTPAEISGILRPLRCEGRTVGLVPTMGALHEGHLSLVRLARGRADFVVVSIFVNPKQFGPGEDLESYPRDEAHDEEVLEGTGCDLLYMPAAEDVFCSGERTLITVKGLSDNLCGASRPGHFQGVALIVAKLFNTVQPEEAYFGQKDAQQAVLIQRMTADLDFPVRIVLGPTVREEDGLAMSSRNAYLSDDERERAPALFGALSLARDKILKGERSVSKLKASMRSTMEKAGFDVDYAEIVDGETLEPIERIEGILLIAAAGRIGRARLIDNVALKVSGEGVEEVLLEFPHWRRYGF